MLKCRSGCGYCTSYFPLASLDPSPYSITILCPDRCTCKATSAGSLAHSLPVRFSQWDLQWKLRRRQGIYSPGFFSCFASNWRHLARQDQSVPQAYYLLYKTSFFLTKVTSPSACLFRPNKGQSHKS